MVLYPVPVIDETAEPTLDGQPDENAHANCVPAALASALTFLTGRTYVGDQLKDAVYGQGYVGATDPAHFSAYLAAQGVRMWQLSGQGEQLVQQIRQLLDSPGPILVTGAIPSLWGDNFPGGQAMVDFQASTHEVTWNGADAGSLTAMNPWHPAALFPAPDHYQTEPDSWWAARIVYGRIFGLERTAMSTVTPSWDAATGTLTYPAHDGLPEIALDHAQGWYAHSGRVGLYPLLPHFYTAAGDDVVLWSDCSQSRAVKAQNWAVVIEPAAAALAAAWTQAHIPPEPPAPAVQILVDGQPVTAPFSVTHTVEVH